MVKTGRRGLVTVVHQAERAYREFLGRNRVLLEPGLHVRLPLLHHVTRVDMREQWSVVGVHGYTRDNVPVTIDAAVFFTIEDAHRACFGVKGVVESVRTVAASTVRTVIGRFDYDAIIRERTALTNELVREVGASVDAWGVRCGKMEVMGFHPQNAQVAAQLEKQMEAERRRRANELDTAAAVVTAEGEKRRAELEAEGRAAAVKVEADAAKYAAARRAEAAAVEVEALAKTLGSTDAATAYLVERAKLAHLAAVATAGNAAYFVPDSASLLPAVAVHAAAKLK